ncbi:Ribonuclease H [Teratosphaeria destructans]|uniref:Ribonuclease H n=1 Tax=Teratosphaeria destructans TaxID=418781 RepID=A0A9W7SI67_9PEZI|nr:Ribonuclease H [Teratosphaeria destructans]
MRCKRRIEGDETATSRCLKAQLLWTRTGCSRTAGQLLRTTAVLHGIEAPKRLYDLPDRERKEFGALSLGFPITRRPGEFRRPLSDALPSDIWAWIKSQHPLFMGNVAMTPEERLRGARVLYTWKDIFFNKVGDVPVTDLICHTISTYPDAKPFAAKLPKYSPGEKAF